MLVRREGLLGFLIGCGLFSPTRSAAVAVSWSSMASMIPRRQYPTADVLRGRLLRAPARFAHWLLLEGAKRAVD